MKDIADQTVLELSDATVVKNGTRVLDSVTLRIRQGEHTAILGPNGSGKSTLVNLLTHQDRALSQGDGAPRVQVFGNSRWNIFELRSRLGIVSGDLHHRFVNGNSAGRISGEDAVLSGFFASHGVIRPSAVTEEMRRRATESLESMEATHLRAKMLNEMSTGEARRVLIARALVTSPQALVLDEPAEGLDIVARRRLLEHVRRIVARGTTLVLVTHHVEDVVPEVERLILLKSGRVAFDGPKGSILSADRLSSLFGAPVTLHSINGYYYARVADI